MKIISKFTDYYDSAVCSTYCNDSESVFVRKSYSEKNLAPLKYRSQNNYRESVYLGALFKQTEYFYNIFGFCGKLYPAISVEMENDEILFYDSKTIIDDYLEKLNAQQQKVLRKELTKKYRLFNKSKSETTQEYILRSSNTLFSNLENYNLWVSDYFLKYSTPYFRIKSDGKTSSLFINFDSLRKVQFYKLYSAPQVYQEIEMYFNSVLTQHENPLQITDNKILLQSKGFDAKTSFRHPTK